MASRWIASGKTEDVTERMCQCWSIDLSLAAKEAYYMLRVGVRYVNRIYDVLFEDLLDTAKQTRLSVIGVVVLILFSPCYSACAITYFADFEHEQISSNEAGGLVDVLDVLMDVGAHGQIFGFILNFKNRYNMLNGEEEDVGYIPKRRIPWCSTR